MKKVLFPLLMVVMGLQAYSQSPGRLVNLRPSYPIAVGSFFTDSFQYTHNGLDLCDIIQDSLPVYEIGHIFEQTVQYTEDGHGFYVKADSLHSNHVTYSYTVLDTLSRGPMEFNPTTGRFKYYPLATDYESFFVSFCATSGNDSVIETVRFNLNAQVAQERYAFQTQGAMPDGTDYTLITETPRDTQFLNNMRRRVYSVSVSGKDLVFDNSTHNKIWGLSGREDLLELNIYAENLIIRSALNFPQTNVTIHAKEIRFEDQNGEISSINTTPSPLLVSLTNDTGANGSTAGNISVYAKDFVVDRNIRFISKGSNGQNANRNGVPGNGGNGGLVTSNHDIRALCDYVRGSCGVRYDVDSSAANNLGAITGSGATGTDGYFVLEDAPWEFLHPYYVSAVVWHTNDAFINGYVDYTKEKCYEYRDLIEKYIVEATVDTCGTEVEIELKNELAEITSILMRLEQDLDYFGNPVGWVPMLSFEVMLTNYNNEVDRAMPMLYLNYWLSRVDQTLQNRLLAAQTSATMAENEIHEVIAAIEDLITQIPLLEDLSEDISSKIDSVTVKIEQLKDQLMAKARKNVKKKNRIKKAVAICKGVANVVATVYPPVGVPLAAAVNYAAGNKWVMKQLTGEEYKFDTVVKAIGDVTKDTNYLKKLKEVERATRHAVTGGFSFKELTSAYSKLGKASTSMAKSLIKVNDILSHGSTPQSEVDAEFNRLKAESPEWKVFESELKVLNDKKNDLQVRINKVFTDMTSASSELSENVVALDAFRRDAFVNNSKRDLHAMQYMEKMNQRAKNRLQKYYYYVRKAYEYRMLKPYVGEFNLVGMFDRFEQLGLTLDSVVDPTAYQTLGGIFKDVVSGVVEEIVDEYSNNYPEQSAPINIVIPQEQLDIINNDGTITLNFYEMGIFSPDEENVRIVDFSVRHIDAHVEGNIGYTGYMDLNMIHSGISKFRNDGEMYWFDHRSRSTTNPHTWGVRYDAVTHNNTPIQPSFASQSLLYSILDESSATGNIMLFSRPSAWGDITVSKKVHTSGGGEIIVDSLVLRLQYDFMSRRNNLRNIDIVTNDGLTPYIACSEQDVKGRSNGNGELSRSYIVSSNSVTFTAIEQYGTYHFLNWTDRAGNVVSDSTALTVRRTTDQFYRANYERRVPILAVPDTIKVAHCGGPVTVQVLNVGSGDEEMDWYVDDSLSTWVHLDGIAEGIDSGFFTFLCDSNESGVRRVDSLEIYAPETDAMVKTIYIAQVDSAELLSIRQVEEHTPNTLRVYPNPANTSVTIEGRDIRWVTVYTTMGRKVLVIKMNGESHCTFGIDELPDGIYILDVTTGNGPVRQKLVKSTR